MLLKLIESGDAAASERSAEKASELVGGMEN